MPHEDRDKMAILKDKQQQQKPIHRCKHKMDQDKALQPLLKMCLEWEERVTLDDYY